MYLTLTGIYTEWEEQVDDGDTLRHVQLVPVVIWHLLRVSLKKL